MIVKCGKHTVELYDSMHDLSILRFQRLNKYQMNAFEIGSTFDDYDRKTENVYKFLQKKMTEEAMQELNNRRMTVFNAFNEYTPTGRALAILIKRINDRVYTDFSPNALDEILKRLDEIGFTYKMTIDKINEVKKKSKPNVLSIFRNIFQRITMLKKQSYV